MSNKRSAVELLLDSTNNLEDDLAYHSTYSKIWRSHQRQEEKTPGLPKSEQEESSFGEWKAKKTEPLLLKMGSSLNFDKKRDVMQNKPKFKLDQKAQLSERFGHKNTIHHQVLTRSISRKEKQNFIVRSSADSTNLKRIESMVVSGI